MCGIGFCSGIPDVTDALARMAAAMRHRGPDDRGFALVAGSSADLVDTARGERVDEDALLAALKSGHLAGAAVDVLAAESSVNLPEHPLVAFARADGRLILTPPIGGCTRESMERTEGFMSQQLRSCLPSTDVE